MIYIKVVQPAIKFEKSIFKELLKYQVTMTRAEQNWKKGSQVLTKVNRRLAFF